MPQNYDKVDFAWTAGGDIVLGHSGDILDTSHDPLRSLHQECVTRIKSEIKDWKSYPDLGASISDFVGEPNNKLIAEAIKTRITAALTKHGFINSKDISIKYAPIDIDRILFRITITVLATAENRGSNYIKINTLYNYGENNIFAR